MVDGTGSFAYRIPYSAIAPAILYVQRFQKGLCIIHRTQVYLRE
jgi:hypothetical protein